jgi:hypothetical protein
MHKITHYPTQAKYENKLSAVTVTSSIGPGFSEFSMDTPIQLHHDDDCSRAPSDRLR